MRVESDDRMDVQDTYTSRDTSSAAQCCSAAALLWNVPSFSAVALDRLAEWTRVVGQGSDVMLGRAPEKRPGPWPCGVRLRQHRSTGQHNTARVTLEYV